MAETIAKEAVETIAEKAAETEEAVAEVTAETIAEEMAKYLTDEVAETEIITVKIKDGRDRGVGQKCGKFSVFLGGPVWLEV